jgi:molybdate transport system ATP-binding protein
MTLEVHGRARVGTFVLHIDLTITGETVAIVGDNGVGKTTLLNVVAGIVQLESGSVTLGGEVVDDPRAGICVTSQRRGVAMLFQDPLLFPHLSVLDNVAFALRRRGIAREPARNEALDALVRFGVGDLASRGIDTLARALVCDPRVVLLDEPFSSLDRRTREEFRAMLADDFAAMSSPRLIVTHDDADIAALCSRQIEVVMTGPREACVSGEGGLTR